MTDPETACTAEIECEDADTNETQPELTNIFLLQQLPLQTRESLADDVTINPDISFPQKERANHLLNKYQAGMTAIPRRTSCGEHFINLKEN